MKTILRFSLLLVLAAATQAMAAFESARLDSNNLMPRFPARLVVEGVTQGQVVFAISINAEGKLSNSLVLAYTNEAFVRSCEYAMRDWKITPAQLDGENVATQVELRMNFSREGFIETNSANITDHFLHETTRQRRESTLVYHVYRGSELDRPLVPVTTVAPRYGRDAEKQGVRGKVRVYFYVNEKGEVQLPSVSVDAHPYLAGIAVDALRQWKFQPPTHGGDPVMISAAQEFDFGRID